MTTIEKTADNSVILFKNTSGNCSIILKSLTKVSFIDGKFFTTNKKLQAELEAEAEDGNFGLYIDTAEPSIDPNFATPMDQLRERLRKELMAELAAGGKLVDAGSSVVQPGQTQQSMSTTNNVVGAADLTPEEQAIKDGQAETKELTPAEKLLAAAKAGAK